MWVSPVDQPDGESGIEPSKAPRGERWNSRPMALTVQQLPVRQSPVDFEAADWGPECRGANRCLLRGP
jgi:hypothetical protein